MKNLSNHLLISAPFISDHIFKKSIIFLCEHNDEGAMGIIINKPIENHKINDLLYEIGLSNLKNNPNIYFGGPVSLDLGYILHESTYKNNHTLKISKSFSLTSNDTIIKDIKNGVGPKKFRFSLGYAGWSKNQLEKEIENGDWMITSATSQLIFDTPDKNKWNNIANELGFDLNNLAGISGKA